MTRKLKLNRIACVVPFCGRTRAGSGFEWICMIHWPMVDRALRRRLARCRRLIKKAYRLGRAGVAEALARSFDQTWETCKAQAIERAAGIS
ncbi:hypothetical protein [Dongia deserti]|uniref:hypothetical protein n=1 Tax=Dongia deserti TaxID=2268030 RepID=UPI000E648839|nr:hypothetical protein [Dongia deserti]